MSWVEIIGENLLETCHLSVLQEAGEMYGGGHYFELEDTVTGERYRVEIKGQVARLFILAES